MNGNGWYHSKSWQRGGHTSVSAFSGISIAKFMGKELDYLVANKYMYISK